MYGFYIHFNELFGIICLSVILMTPFKPWRSFSEYFKTGRISCIDSTIERPFFSFLLSLKNEVDFSVT